MRPGHIRLYAVAALLLLLPLAAHSYNNATNTSALSSSQTASQGSRTPSVSDSDTLSFTTPASLSLSVTTTASQLQSSSESMTASDTIVAAATETPTFSDTLRFTTPSSLSLSLGTASVTAVLENPPTSSEQLSVSSTIYASRTSSVVSSVTTSISRTDTSLCLGYSTAECEDVKEMCYWSAVRFQACVPLTELDFLADNFVDGVDVHDTLFIDFSDSIRVFGKPNLSNGSLFLASTSCQVAASNPSQATPLSSNVTSTSPPSFDVIVDSNVRRGEYELCMRINGVVISLENVTVSGGVQRRLDACDLELTAGQQDIYDNIAFKVNFVGLGFGATTVVALIPDSIADCNSSLATPYYSPLASLANESHGSLEYTIAGNGSFAVCVGWLSNVAGSEDLVIVDRCSGLALKSTGAPPWESISVRDSVARSIAVSAGRTVADVNSDKCRSVEPQTVLLDNQRGSTSLGSPSFPYGQDEECLVVIDTEYIAKNISNSGTTQNQDYAAVEVSLDYSRSAADVVVAMYIQNDAALSGNVATISPLNGPSCPSSGRIPGYSLAYTRTSDRTDTSSDVMAPTGPIIVALCTDSSSSGGRQLSLSYRTRESWCPNDCKDGSGNPRGNCVGSGSSAQCICDPLWGGPSCDEYTGCTSGADSPVLTGSGTGRIQVSNMSGDSVCGYRVVPDWSKHDRRGPLGLGFKLEPQVTLRSANCSMNFIRFLSGASGAELQRICQSDLPTYRGLPWLLKATDGTPFSGTVVIEVLADTTDTVSLDFISVALSCPGNIDGLGFLIPGEECGGQGNCVDVSYGALGQLMDTAKKCACRYPLAASVVGRTCDTCAFGIDPQLYPNCTQSSVCATNCSGRGSCSTGTCSCDGSSFGTDCRYDVVDTVQMPNRLLLRSPLDEGVSGDSKSAGGVERQLMTCELFGRICVAARRLRGKIYGGLRRRQAAQSGGRRQVAAASDDSSSGASDAGVMLNVVQTPGIAGDFVVQENIAGSDADLSGDFTVSAWVQLTRQSDGFLLVKTDDARTAEGTFPLVDAAFREVRDRRNRPKIIDGDSLSVYFGMFVNGAQRQLDVIVSSGAATTNSTTPSTREVAVRHFRLDDDEHDLFDGSWRFLTLALDKKKNRGRIYVDGKTNPLSPGYMQCFPFMPSSIATPADADRTSRYGPEIGRFSRGGALVLGYGLRGAIDEVRIYEGAVSQAMIVEMGGDVLLDALRENRIALYAMSSFGGVVCLLAAALRLGLKNKASEVIGGKQKEDAQQSNEDKYADGDNESSMHVDEWLDEHVEKRFHADEAEEAELSGTSSNGMLRAAERCLFAAYQLMLLQPATRQYVTDEVIAPLDEASSQGCMNLTVSAASARPDEPLVVDLDEENAEPVPASPNTRNHLVSAAYYQHPLAEELNLHALDELDLFDTLSSTTSPRSISGGLGADSRYAGSTTLTAERRQQLENDARQFNLDDVDAVIKPTASKQQSLSASAAAVSHSQSRAASESASPKMRLGGSGVGFGDISFALDESEPSERAGVGNPAVSFSGSLVIALGDEEAPVDDLKRRSSRKVISPEFPRSSSRAGSLSGSRRGRNKVAFVHPRPSLFNLLQWDIFADDMLSTEEEAKSRLHEWLQSHFSMDSPTTVQATDDHPEESPSDLAGDLERIVDEFIHLCHGFRNWKEQDEVFALQTTLTKLLEGEDAAKQLALVQNQRQLQILSGILLMNSRATLEHPVVQDALEKIGVHPKQQSADKKENTGNGAPAPAADRPGEPSVDSESASADAMVVGDASRFEKIRYVVTRHILELGQRIVLLRDFWQILSLLLVAMTFAPRTNEVFGPPSSGVALSLDSQLGIPFVGAFLVCCVVSMFAFLILLGIFLYELKSGAGAEALQLTLVEQLKRQQERVEKHLPPKKSHSKAERLVQVILMVLLTLYLPTTRMVLMGVFCHEQVLCLYDCYVDPEHKMIVAVGIVVGICVSIVFPFLLFGATLRKQREFHAFVGNSSNDVSDRKADDDVELLWEQYLTVDVSPFNSLYAPYRRRWGQFAALMLLVKACYIVIALVIPPDTTAQITSTTMILSVVTLLSATIEPFRFPVCNVLLTWLQIALQFILSLHVAYRLNPEELEDPVSITQVVAISIVVIAHAPAISYKLDAQRV